VASNLTLSIVIPTYRRGEVLLDTLKYLFDQDPIAVEILLVDQTSYQPEDPVAGQLAMWQAEGRLRWLKRLQPSIPAAMNTGLLEAVGDLVLFLDDDIVPHQDLCTHHIDGFVDASVIATVGQILQPGQKPVPTKQSKEIGSLWDDLDFTFNGTEPASIRNCMAGNLCVRRLAAIECGGFDERFTQVAYRFETEFIRRFLRVSHRQDDDNILSADSDKPQVRYLPKPGIDHLQLASGGTRTHSRDHLRHPKILDGVGDYYFAYRESTGFVRWRYCMHRLLRSMRTRFYLTHPWYLPKKAIAEIGAWLKASRMQSMAPKLLNKGERPKTKFAAVISHPIQHYSPLFRALNQLDDIDVHVIYFCDLGTGDDLDHGFGVKVKWDVPLLDGYEHSFLKTNFVPNTFGFWEMSSSNVRKQLDQIAPDVIWLHGYSQKFIWDTLFWAKGRAQTIHFADSELLHERRWYHRVVKQLLLRGFFSQCDLFMSVGDNNRAYYRHYGVPDKKLFAGACPVDITRLDKARASEPIDQVEALRSLLSIGSDSFVILFSGKLVDYKRPLDLVHALAALPASAHVLFLGEGEQRAAIEQLAQELKVSERLTITGFVNQSELHRYMMLADILAVTSERDAHPLVVTEGLVFGLPVVASSMVGCVGDTDTAQPNKNALIYPVGNAVKLAEAISQLMSDKELCQRMSTHSSSMASSQSAETVAATIASVIQQPFPCTADHSCETHNSEGAS